jgi:PAS domain-containing protein
MAQTIDRYIREVATSTKARVQWFEDHGYLPKEELNPGYRMVLDASPERLWLSSSALPHGCLYCNLAWRKWAGYPSDTDFSRWGDWVYPEHRHLVMDWYFKAVESYSPYFLNFKLRSASGVYRWIYSEAHPMPSGGAFRGFFGKAITLGVGAGSDSGLYATGGIIRDHDREAAPPGNSPSSDDRIQTRSAA